MFSFLPGARGVPPETDINLKENTVKLLTRSVNSGTSRLTRKDGTHGNVVLLIMLEKTQLLRYPVNLKIG